MCPVNWNLNLMQQVRGFSEILQSDNSDLHGAWCFAQHHSVNHWLSLSQSQETPDSPSLTYCLTTCNITQSPLWCSKLFTCKWDTEWVQGAFPHGQFYLTFVAKKSNRSSLCLIPKGLAGCRDRFSWRSRVQVFKRVFFWNRNSLVHVFMRSLILGGFPPLLRVWEIFRLFQCWPSWCPLELLLPSAMEDEGTGLLHQPSLSPCMSENCCT